MRAESILQLSAISSLHGSPPCDVREPTLLQRNGKHTPASRHGAKDLETPTATFNLVMVLELLATLLVSLSN